MNNKIREELINLAHKHIPNHDVSHDLSHALRVLANAEYIASQEGGDMDIIISSALFHDVIVYPKDHPDRYKSQEDSAHLAEKLISQINEFPKQKISAIKKCILECSFSKGIIPDTIEGKILQDSDGLEATGAISIMRTYSSTGQMKRPFYNDIDPFCENRKADASTNALDLFYERLLVVKDRMHTQTAKQIALRRTDFLNIFLDEFKLELEGK